MDAFESRFHRDVKVEIDGLITTRMSGIGNGNCRTFEDYHKQVGFLSGLAQALEIMERVRSEHAQPHVRAV